MKVEPLTAVTDYGHDAEAPMGLLLLCSRWRLVAGLVAVSWLGGAELSAAELDPVALLWSAPAGCPSGDAVHDQVERALGGSLKDLAPVAAVVNAAEASPGRWQARLTVTSRGERAERQFEAESCDALSAAAALIIALAAEGPATAPVGPSGEAGPPQRPDGQMLAVTASGPSLSMSRAATGWNRNGLVARLDMVLDSGTMPRTPEAGIEAAVGGIWASDLWRLRLLGGLGYFLPQDNVGAVGYETLGRYWLLSLSGRGCVTAALLRFELGPCLGGELIAMHGSNIGGGPATSTQYWFAPVGSAVAAFTVAPGVVVFAQAEISVPSTRRSFLGVGFAPGTVNEVYMVPAYAVRGAAGIELRFF